jgi:hypothetical protein
MKLTFELKDGNLEYTLDIGANKRSGSRPWGSNDVKFLLDADEWLDKHTLQLDIITKSNNIIREANEFMKNLFIATGDYEKAAGIWKQIKDLQEKTSVAQEPKAIQPTQP